MPDQDGARLSEAGPWDLPAVLSLHREVEADKPGAYGLYRRAGIDEHERRPMSELFEDDDQDTGPGT